MDVAQSLLQLVFERLLRLAVELAYRGIGFAAPNPLVGCIVIKNKKIIGRGWHAHYGEAHAEVNAIRTAEEYGFSVAGAEVFVTLEPCAHFGSTPPCVDLLIAKKIAAVYVLFADPNPEVAGKSLEKLQANGMKVFADFPELRREYFDLYEDFFHFITTKKPFVALKMAMDKNGFMAEKDAQAVRIGGKEQEMHTHFLRQRFAAILVGANTVINDDPHLGVRFGEFHQGRRDPLRIIFDPQLRTPKTAQVFRDENFLLITTKEQKTAAEKKFGKMVRIVKTLKNGNFDLPELLNILGNEKIMSILVEGGKKTAESFIQQKCAQKGYFFASKKALITDGIPGIDFKKIPQWKLQRKQEFGDDVLWEGMIGNSKAFDPGAKNT